MSKGIGRTQRAILHALARLETQYGQDEFRIAVILNQVAQDADLVAIEARRMAEFRESKAAHRALQAN